MTALTYMAAPAISDARVPCPLCGGLIHPVAGRCKHCKESLAQFRNGRPAAATALPALQGNGASPATGVPVAVDKIESQPVLPPRPTGRTAAVQEPRASLLRSWPVVVIVIAVLAIGTAVVLMMWPPSNSDAGKHALQPPPAPEHMETNPLPPAGGGGNSSDPWSAPHSQADPRPAPRPTPDPLPADPVKPDDDDDVFGGITGGGGGVFGNITPPTGTFGGGNFGSSATFMYTALDHLCRKAKTCPGVDQAIVMVCDQLAGIPRTATPNCAAAQRCLEAVDNMSCSQTTSVNVASTIMTVQDCMTAMTRC